MSNNIFFERGQMADKPNNYLWNGDCLELMKDIPDNSMDAIICDLPYGTTRNKWDSVIPFEPLWEQYNRIIKDNGAIVLFSAQPFSSALIMSNPKMFKYDLIWDKIKATGHLNASRMPMRRHEVILLFYKKPPTYNKQTEERSVNSNSMGLNYTKIKEATKQKNYGEIKERKQKKMLDNNLKYTDSIIRITRGNSKGKYKQLHPTQKPLELLKYLVKTYTNENDWVLDNTCGSNTTGIACYDLNRNYIGIEKDIDIYEVAKKRMEENILLRANKPKTLFDDRP